jgi:N-methylhydantoinase B/oxoprolinase/acetone carboxylase alpha subunit
MTETEEEWVLVDKIQGQLPAEIIKGLLEAQGIQVWLNAQGAARAYAVTVGTLGAVELLVPSSQADQARKILEEYNRGDFENMKLDESEPGEGSEE